MEAPAMERVGGGPALVMVAPDVCGTGGCKPGMERVGLAPLTSIKDSSEIQTLPGDSCCKYRG